MSKEVYLVTFNGWFDDYGSYIYSLGVFDSEEKATQAIEEAKEKINFKTSYDRDAFDPLITQMDLNEALETRETRVKQDGEWIDEIKTDIFLGGYAE